MGFVLKKSLKKKRLFISIIPNKYESIFIFLFYLINSTNINGIDGVYFTDHNK